jgi:hypothetical protein
VQHIWAECKLRPRKSRAHQLMTAPKSMLQLTMWGQIMPLPLRVFWATRSRQ